MHSASVLPGRYVFRRPHKIGTLRLGRFSVEIVTMTYGEDDLISPGKYRRRRRRRSTRHYVFLLLLFNIIYATRRHTHADDIIL